MMSKVSAPRKIPECNKALEQAIESPENAYGMATVQATYNSWDFVYSSGKWPLTPDQLTDTLCIAAKSQGIGTVRALSASKILDPARTLRVFLAAAQYAGPAVLEFAPSSLNEEHRVQIAIKGLPFSPLDLFGVLEKLPAKARPDLQRQAVQIANTHKTHDRVQTAFQRHKTEIEHLHPEFAKTF